MNPMVPNIRMGGEVLDGVQTGFVQCRVGYRVGQCERGHIEGYAQRIECKENAEFDVGSARHAVVAGQCHKEGGNKVAET